MVFSSIYFLYYFLPAVLIIYFLTPRKFKNSILLIFSLFFYSWGEPVYVILMIFSIIANYILGLVMDKKMKIYDKNRAILILVISIILNLSLIGFFKYADFIISNINYIFNIDIELLNLPLPIGISFYTFQILSYIIDLYNGEVKVQKNIINFGTYVSLFPQLVAGPIVRIKTIACELVTRKENFEQFSSGIKKFIIGLGKKVLLANQIGIVWNEISAIKPNELSIMTSWIGLIAFTFQIYFDFSGYSDMAIGLGRMFGFDFPENFNYPYISKSITEFWRRWHISLSTWFREYLYIPLGGNKRGLKIQIRNIIIVWLLTGFWHGASWNFIVWGLYYSILLIVEKTFSKIFYKNIFNFIKHIYTMILVIIGWGLFAFDSLHESINFIKSLFGLYGQNILDSRFIYIFYNNIILILILIFGCTSLPKNLFYKLNNYAKKYAFIYNILESFGIIIILFLSTAFLLDASYNPFLYFKF